MISGKELVSDQFLSCGFFDDYGWDRTSTTHMAPLLLHYRTGCYCSLLRSVYWWSGPNPGCLVDDHEMTQTGRIKCLQISAFLPLVPAICTQSYSVPKYTHPAAQSLFPWAMDPQYWVPLIPLANSTQPKSSFLKYHCWNLFLLLPAWGQSIFKRLSSFYLYGTQCNVQVRHIRRTNGLLKRL